MSGNFMTKQKFINQWLRHFAKGIERKELDRCYVDQFIWHIFSFGLLKEEAFLVGDAARLAYDNADKAACIFCDWFGKNGVTDKMLKEYNSSKDIDDNITELYVVAKDYSWTYIKTHECDFCGPYFMRIR